MGILQKVRMLAAEKGTGDVEAEGTATGPSVPVVHGATPSEATAATTKALAKAPPTAQRPTDPIDLLACAIARQEGWFAQGTNRPKEYNNPGDLDFANQAGALRMKGRFAKFPDAQWGIMALKRQIWLQVAEGQTVRQIIAQWAPPTENDTSQYLEDVLLWTALPPDVPVRTLLPPLVFIDAPQATQVSSSAPKR